MHLLLTCAMLGWQSAIDTKYDLESHQMDVYTAFLGLDLEDGIYILPLQGYFRLLQHESQFIDPGVTKTLRKMVLRLRKSLYALKQSLYDWCGTFKDC
jgi:hypothetical protein